MSTVLLDTHVVHWLSAEPKRLSRAATRAIEQADELAVAAISWYELAWLAHHGRITVAVPVRAWLDEIHRRVRTIGVTPAIADAAATLAESFPGGPADRLIYASALELGIPLVTKDQKLRSHRHPASPTVW